MAEISKSGNQEVGNQQTGKPGRSELITWYSDNHCLITRWPDIHCGLKKQSQF